MFIFSYANFKEKYIRDRILAQLLLLLIFTSLRDNSFLFGIFKFQKYYWNQIKPNNQHVGTSGSKHCALLKGVRKHIKLKFGYLVLQLVESVHEDKICVLDI